MTDPHPDPDRLVALALADLEPAEQERLSAHLVGCAACRDIYAEVADGLAQALAATPPIAPPAGFSGRVVAAMGRPAAPPTASARAAGSGRWLSLAAALLIGVLGGIGGTIAATARWDTPAVPAAGHAPVAVSLVTDVGDTVGSVGLARLAGRGYLVLNVTEGRPGATYECVLVAGDGKRTSGGTWTLSDEYGSGNASGSWLVPLQDGAPAAVELVSASEKVWARGRF